MTQLALRLAGVCFSEWWKAMRTGVLGCVCMGVSILLTKSFLAGTLSTGFVLSAIGCIGLVVYVALIRLSLSSEDARFAELVSRILPPRVGSLLRSILGINSATLCPEVRGNIVA